MEKILFLKVPESMKCLSIKQTKYVQVLQAENYITKNTKGKEKVYHVHGSVLLIVLSQWIYKQHNPIRSYRDIL